MKIKLNNVVRICFKQCFSRSCHSIVNMLCCSALHPCMEKGTQAIEMRCHLFECQDLQLYALCTQENAGFVVTNSSDSLRLPPLLCSLSNSY